MFAAKTININERSIFWEKVDLQEESNVKWFNNWSKSKPPVFLNILRVTIQQLTEDTEDESIWFSLEDFINLELKSWLCICEHEYLKLIHITLFHKLTEHNLINHHVFYVYRAYLIKYAKD